ncbi:phosphoribosylformylglycinamidine synthase [Candidatus Parcubacteria bacterium]|nr:MAG: phosphoribosylformylglycinamidine synthase [Candidatus Parcubacteria bacterium]
MLSRIDITYSIPDARAVTKKKYFEGLGLRGTVRDVVLVDSYVIDASLNSKELRRASEFLVNPLIEKYSINTPQAPKKFNWAIEIEPLPGVTDNIGTTVREVIEDGVGRRFKTGENVYASQAFFVSGRLSREDAESIADSLHNPLIQRAHIKNYREFRRDGGMGVAVPKVKLLRERPVIEVNLEVGEGELEEIGKSGVLDPKGFRRGPLGLDARSMEAIRAHFRTLGRDPTDVELESIAQTWSEHCKHTIFANPIDEVPHGLYRTYIKAATEEVRRRKGKKDFCVSVFTDNSGAIAFDRDYLVTHKVETHNSPSALDPFGGAITGIVGVNRDAIGFGLGAKPVINIYGFCFADPRDTSVLYRDAARTQRMLSARRIMEGVVKGVNTGGNCSGIPTPQGFVLFDKRYRGKPLVFAGTVGLIPRKSKNRLSHVKRARPGDYVVMVGNRVGIDGIHGATFSSGALDSRSPIAAVQIDDTVTQKKMSDALVKESRDKALYTSITDNGAGGLSCSVAEMAKESGGCLVDLHKAPLKYPGLLPWQIWISETQDRMTLAVPKKKWRQFSDLMKRRGVEATVIGIFTNSGRCVVKYERKTVMNLNLDFLHDGWPKRHLRTTQPFVSRKEMTPPPSRNLSRDFLKMLARPNLASYAFISEQFDHEVQAGSVLKPLVGRGRVNGDATATRPLLHSNRAVVLSHGVCPTYSDVNTYHMAASAVDSAVRGAVAAGADPDNLALLDNFCWSSSYDPERLAELKSACEACYDYATAYGTPFISGKDSMFNDFKGFDEEGRPIKVSVPPTLLISAIGVVQDARRCISIDFKMPGDLIYLLGDTHNELGASEYYAMRGELGDSVPRVDSARNITIYRKLFRAIRKGLVASSVSVGRGGLAIALAKSSMAAKLGADVSFRLLGGSATRDDVLLFSESQGRILVSVSPEKRKEFEKVFKEKSIALLGRVTWERVLKIRRKSGKAVARLGVDSMLQAYRSMFRKY